jgi:hypothetical protein
LIAVAAVIVYLLMPRSAHWKEEIRLSDGTQLILNRGLVYGGGGEVGQGDAITKWTINFALPDGGRSVDFEAPGGLQPVLLDIDAGTLYLAARAARGDAYYALGCPNPPFVFHRYSNGWQPISPKEFPAKFTSANLPLQTAEYEKLANAGSVISAAKIGELNQLRSIDSQAKKIWTDPIVTGRNSLCGKPV